MATTTTTRKTKEFICKCFYSRNIYLQKYKLHVAFENEDQFTEDYRQDLRMQGCATNQQYDHVLAEIRKEVDRRKNFHLDAMKRNETITESYKRIHPDIWSLKASFLDERLVDIVKSITDVSDTNVETAESIVLQNGGNIVGNHLYRIPVFKPEFCKQLLEELFHFEESSCPKGRPNTMSKHGISLDELGISADLLTPLIVDYLQPLSTALFGSQQCETLDSFRAFSVLYGTDKDIELSEHYDNAEVTLIVCLTDQFTGGELEFKGFWNEPDSDAAHETVLHNKIGTGLLHLGQHIHRAHPIESGTRCNLVVWMRSSGIRNKICPMCGCSPVLHEVPFEGDGFTMSCDQTGQCTTL